MVEFRKGDSMEKLLSYLARNTYPGRAILMGRLADSRPFLSFVLTGKRKESLNRVIRKTEDGIRLEFYDEKIKGNSKILIYNPLRIFEGKAILSNGNQSDTIKESLENWDTFTSAMFLHKADDDRPGNSKIAGILDLRNGDLKMSVLKKDEDGVDERFFYNYERIIDGRAFFISSYSAPGVPFTGEPLKIRCETDLGTIHRTIWNAIAAEHRISLYSAAFGGDCSISEEIVTNRLIEEKAQNA